MKNYESLIKEKARELNDLNHKTEKIEEKIKKQKKMNSTQRNKRNYKSKQRFHEIISQFKYSPRRK